MNEHCANRCLAAGLALLLGTCVGCGAGNYDTRLEETVKRLGQESPFGEMYPPVQLPGTQVMVQLPKSLPESPLPSDFDARRLKPPLVSLPDLKSTYEGFYTYPDGSKIAFYCYLAVADAAAAGSRSPADQLRSQLQGALIDWSGRWEPVQCETPTGQVTSWERLQCITEQDFYFFKADGNPEFRKGKGTMEFYNRREGDLMLIIGWWVLSDLQGKDYVGLEQWAPRVAGSVTLKK
jgi:hypothetical protein